MSSAEPCRNGQSRRRLAGLLKCGGQLRRFGFLHEAFTGSAPIARWAGSAFLHQRAQSALARLQAPLRSTLSSTFSRLFAGPVRARAIRSTSGTARRSRCARLQVESPTRWRRSSAKAVLRRRPGSTGRGNPHLFASTITPAELRLADLPFASNSAAFGPLLGARADLACAPVVSPSRSMPGSIRVDRSWGRTSSQLGGRPSRRDQRGTLAALLLDQSRVTRPVLPLPVMPTTTRGLPRVLPQPESLAPHCPLSAARLPVIPVS